MPLKLTKKSYRDKRAGQIRETENWYIRGTVAGIYIEESTGTSVEALADAKRIEREGEVSQRGVLGKKATTSFIEAALAYIQSGGEKRFIGTHDPTTDKWSGLIGYFYTTALREIDQSAIDDACLALYPNRSRATWVRQVYAPMGAILRFSAKRKLCDAPLLDRPKIEPADTRWADFEYVAALVPHCGPRLRRLVLTLIYTGRRLGELTSRQVRHCDKQNRMIWLGITKNGNPYGAYLADEIMDEFDDLPSDPTAPLFGWSANRSVYKPLKKACEAAGLDYLPPHQLGRHTYATWMMQSGVNLRDLMAAGGWKSVQSVMRYTHTVVSDAQRGADRLPSLKKSGKPVSKKALKGYNL